MNTDDGQNQAGLSCPAEDDLVAWVFDPTSVEAQERIRLHVKGCTHCQAIVSNVTDMSSALREAEDVPVSDQFLNEVLARIPDEDWKGSATESPIAWPFSPAMRIAVAAGIVALLVVGANLFDRKDVADTKDSITQASIHSGTKWIIDNQQDSGGWDVNDLGGRDSFTPALNGLAVLALTRSGLDHSQVDEPVRKAARYLSDLQVDSGQFGEDTEGMMYNQGIASLALMESYVLTRDESLLPPIKKAIGFIINQQSPFGGWGYGIEEGAKPNTSITAWQVQSLLLAKKLGIQNDQQSLRKGLAWLSATVNGSGYFSYEQKGAEDKQQTVTMMGAHCLFSARNQNIPLDQFVMRRVSDGLETLSASMPGDYYATYFYASALSTADPKAYASFLAETKNSIESRQLSEGVVTGAWDDNDRWGSAGGQLYSTSMALLSLFEQGNDESAGSEPSL